MCLSRKYQVSVIGLGYVGLPLAVMLACENIQVKGFDIRATLISDLESGRFSINEEDLKHDFLNVLKQKMFTPVYQVESSDVYIIAVPTPIDYASKKADLKCLFDAVDEVASVLKEEQIVVIESTIPAGTTEKVKKQLIEKTGLSPEQFDVAHCPERVLPGNTKNELQNNDRIIGSNFNKTAKILEDIYGKILVNGKINHTSVLCAELCKLVENSFRDVNIAFANELSAICNQLGVDVYELIRLSNLHPRVNILSPGAGVGGHCLPVDPWFIVESFPNEALLIRKAREVNDDRPDWVADRVEEKLNYDKNKVIAIMGLSYKPNIDDLRESPAICIVDILINRGYRVLACEPNTSLDMVNGHKILDIEETIEQADFLVLTVPHKQFLTYKALFKTKPTYYCFDSNSVNN